MVMKLPNVIGWRALLTEWQPGTMASVDGAVETVEPNGPKLYVPELELHCHRNCNGPSFASGVVRAAGTFFGFDQQFTGNDRRYDFIICYTCRKCQQEVKSYAVRIVPYGQDEFFLPYVTMIKMGEWPAFSPPTPSRLISMIGPDRELFLKGRQAELQGLGIGAFGYYRGVVENQKNRLLDEIIKVARRVRAPNEAILRLEAAKHESQFSKAVAGVKDAIPQALLVKGNHNPLSLLHAALSRGIHGASDEECLKAANDIRAILIELTERMSQALKDEKELDEALGRLLSPASSRLA